MTYPIDNMTKPTGRKFLVVRRVCHGTTVSASQDRQESVLTEDSDGRAIFMPIAWVRLHNALQRAMRKLTR